MSKKTIHLHLHEQPAPTKKRTADSDEGGRWVTINGSAVHIGEGGKIDKGPGALVGKGEKEAHAHGPTTEHGNADHHLGKVKENIRASGAKGDKHPATKHHEAAADEHFKAHQRLAQAKADPVDGQHHVKAADAHAEKAAGHEKAASKAEAEHAGVKHVTTVKPMPGSHVKLHEAADKDVKGSKKHEAEHNRLQNMYHASESDWERDAVNRKIERNAVEAKQANADNLHETSLKASDFASEHGDAAAHRMASQRLQSAIDAHGRAGGVGYAKKQEELAKRKREHDAETGGPSLVKKEAQQDAATHHRAQAQAHRKPAGELAKPDHKMADLHDEKAAHHEAQAKGEDRSAQIKDLAGRIAQHQSDAMKPKGDTPALSKMEAAVAKRKALEKDPKAPMPKRTTPVAGSAQADFAKAHAASKPKGHDVDSLMSKDHKELEQHHRAEAARHEAAGNGAEATKHHNVAGMHWHAQRDGEGSRSSENAYAQTYQVTTGKKHPGAS